MAHYTYKYRLYPNKDQQTRLAVHFGCCRFVYNHFLAQRKDTYLANGKSPNYYAQAADLTKLKNEKEWLYDTNSQVLQFELKCLQAAYNNFFEKRAKLPKFHSRKDKQSFTVPQFIELKDSKVYFPKFKDGIKVRLHRPLEGEMRHATISKNCAGQYFVAILVERSIKLLKKVKQEVGIDLGICALATTSQGKEYKNIRPYRGLQQRLRALNKNLHRKKLGSNNRERARKTLAKCHIKIANIRNDHLHKVSHQIIDENQVICLETLNVSGMLRNHCLAKSIADISLSELVRQIEYKSEWHGRTVIKVDRWFPSSKTCSECGFVVEKLPLDIREWTCPRCSAKHHRDKNAAINIYREGKRTVGTTGLAYGLSVRPKSNQRRLRMKYETATL
jgi:putative transposase